MALALLTTQKAKINVALDHGDGTQNDLGAQFHFTFDHPFASLQSFADGLYVVAASAGTCTLHVTTMDGSVAADVPVTVSVDTQAPVPSLVVTFGAPVPK